jgi:hypothetical protein
MYAHVTKRVRVSLFFPTAPLSSLSKLVKELELGGDEIECNAEFLYTDTPLWKVFSPHEPLP